MKKKLAPLGFCKLALKGFGMGIADLIPGISGGTIAFITGIYEDLISAIRSFDLIFLRFLLCLRFREAFARVRWQFLAAVLGGILAAIFTLSKVISWLLHHHPVSVHAFFFGLISATVFIIARHLRKRSMISLLLGLASAGAMYWLAGRVPVQTPDAGWFLFASGALAICAMILPGISGAFILLLLGKYQYIIDAVSHRELDVLLIVAAGCAVGLVTFVRVLSWLFLRYHDLTVTVLTGLVLGSLRKVWPWKETLRTIVTHKGKVLPVEEINVFPAGWTQETLVAVVLIGAGFLLAMLLDRSSRKPLVSP